MKTDYLIVHNDDLEHTGETIYGIPVRNWNVNNTEQRNLADDGLRIATARLYEEDRARGHQ